jgi:uncharacterized protein (DUF1501 family)
MNRRAFLNRSLKASLGLSAAPLLPRIFASSALAQTPSSGYKALVCVYLVGGNDGNNMLIPVDGQYQEYAAGRGPLALPSASLLPLPVTSSGRKFGLHPSLKNVASLYTQGQAAFLANCGPIGAPLTKQAIAQGAQTPLNLGSHPDQAAEWQSAISIGGSATGWGGRTADLLASASGVISNIPMIVSTAGWSLFGSGVNQQPVVMGSGANSVTVQSAFAALGPSLSLMEKGDASNHLHDVLSKQQASYISQTNALNSIIAGGTSITTQFPETGIGQQLRSVAQVIAGRSLSGATQQIFFCEDGNQYDFHSSQLFLQANNLTELDGAIGAFANAMKELGIFNSVTLFTMTDFARALQTNDTQGTDHAWGNHHFIVGGGIKRADVYGTFPSLVMGGADDFLSAGCWIPTTSGSQYAATLTRWLGVSAANTATIFPELSKFPISTLGFI